MLIISTLLNCCLDIIQSYDLENSIGFLLYKTAMAFRKALDLNGSDLWSMEDSYFLRRWTDSKRDR
jgi:hypothetical protein